jgi:ABC-type antimicrobial peptide transport system permease subunit
VLLLTIALGVGSNAAVYGFLQGLIHPAIPIEDGERVVSIFGQDRSGRAGPLSADEYERLGARQGLFEWLGAARVEPRSVVMGGHTEIATVADVTPKLAAALSLQFGGGVLITHRMWESQFAGDAKLIGSRIRIDGDDFEIDGVTPDRLDGLYSDQSIDLWMPATRVDLDRQDRERRDLWVVARLLKNVFPARAQAAVVSGAGELNVVPFTGIAPNMARGLSRVGLFLTLSAAAVFLVACINVGSILLGRALRRSHETSLRVALGASRGELLRDLFADSAVIAVAGGCAGLLVGVLTARALPAFLFEGDAQRLTFAPHLVSICAASLLCVGVTAICGMMPAIGTVTDRPWMVLQRETGSPSRAVLRLRSALVVGEIAICCMMAICTAVLLAGLRSAMQTSAGKRLGNPTLLTVQAEPVGGPEIDPRYFDAVEEKVRSVGGMSPMAWTAELPGSEPMWRTFRIQQPSAQFRDVKMDASWLTPESMQSLERLPVAGRMFGIGDQGHSVAVVNETAAAELFGVLTAGMAIRGPGDRHLEIIGVVREAVSEVPSEQENKADIRPMTRPTIYYGYINQAEAPSTVRDEVFRVPVTGPASKIELNANVVSPKYFDALDMPVVAGRKFGADRIAGEGRVAVINREAADLYFNGQALGSGVIDDSGVRTEVVGVVRSQTVGTFEQHAEPTIYFPMWQDCPARMTLMLKSSKRNRGTAADLRQRVGVVPGGNAARSTVTTLDEQLAHSGLAPLRIAILIGGESAAMALMLGLLGMLNAQGDAERQRRRDRALRIALGAQRWRIVLLVMRNAGRLAVFGAAIGIALSFAIVRLLMADGAVVTTPSLDVWVVAALLPVAAVMTVSIVPARSASVIAPAAIMRDL